jgi:hypothetical protein
MRRRKEYVIPEYLKKRTLALLRGKDHWLREGKLS